MSPKRGFTLIEILIYITIVAGILVAATTFAWNIIDSKTKTQARQAVDAHALIIMEKLSQSIRAAQSIDPSSSFNVNLADPGSSGQKLSLTMQDAAQNPTQFDVTNGVLRITQGAGQPEVLSSNLVRITSLTFQNLSSPNTKTAHIGINITIEYLNSDNRPERNASVTSRTSVELHDR